MSYSKKIHTDMEMINWQIDKAHTNLGFRIKHMMISNVHGKFETYSATITTEQDDWTTAKGDIEIRTASINTGDSSRDEHLRSEDFFDSEKYPFILFTNPVVVKIADDKYTLEGDLTIKDISHKIMLQADASEIIKDMDNNYRAGFHITGHLMREDYNLSWNGKLPGGNSLIGNKVYIDCELELFHK